MMKECKELSQQTRDIYKRYESMLANNVKFKIPDKTKHTFNHSKRVLKMALMIGYAEGLSDNQMQALAQACIFHDCGRANGVYDPEHGKRSALTYKICWYLHDDFRFSETAYLAIYYHNLKDKEGIKAFEENHLSDDICVYNILKDADALDRYRINDKNLDISYLRTETAKSDMMLAYARVINKFDNDHMYY